MGLGRILNLLGPISAQNPPERSVFHAWTSSVDF